MIRKIKSALVELHNKDTSLQSVYKGPCGHFNSDRSGEDSSLNLFVNKYKTTVFHPHFYRVFCDFWNKNAE